MLYLRDALYLESETLACTSGNLAVESGPAGGVRPVAALPSPLPASDRVMDCKGRLVTRALACGHHHIYSALARGMPPAPKAPESFVDILEQVWWRLDKCLDADMIRASALATGLHLAMNGVTFCIDHHASPHAVEGSLSIIADALDSLGLGHLLCYEISCRDGQAVAEAGLAEHERFLSAGGAGHVGLHASFTVDEDTLAASVALAEKYGTGLHIHVAEAASDQEHCLATYGKTVVQRLKDSGALDLPQTILAHCVHCTAEDRAILADSPCWVVQNVESNMNNNVGLAGYGYSPRVMLGTDGMYSDMIRAAQICYFSGIGVEKINCGTAYNRLRNVQRHAALHGGILSGCGANSLVILDYDTPTPITQENALGHFFYGFSSRNVHTVISDGRVIVENRELVSANAQEIVQFAREQAERLWARLR